MAAKNEPTNVFQAQTHANLERFAKAVNEYAGFQKQIFDRSFSQFDEMSKLAKSTFEYQIELQNMFRETLLESMSQSAQLFTPKA